MRKHLSIIIPVRNENEYIRPFYYDLLKHINFFDYEIIWINNASSDSTVEEIRDLMNKDLSIRCITLKSESSPSASVICGLNYAKGDIIIIMKGDLQHPALCIPQIITKLESGFDIIKMRPDNANHVSGIKRKTFDFLYKCIPALNDHSSLEISNFLGMRMEVVQDILFTHNHHFFVEQFFNWQEYTIAELNYQNRRHAKHMYKYSQKNLFYKLKESWHNMQPGQLKKFSLAGKAFAGTGIIGTCLLIILNQFKPTPMDPVFFAAAAILVLLGIQLIILSTYHRKLKEDLFHCSRSNQYFVENIYDLSEQINTSAVPIESKNIQIRKVS